jgi:hypothetical protein
MSVVMVLRRISIVDRILHKSLHLSALLIECWRDFKTNLQTIPSIDDCLFSYKEFVLSMIVDIMLPKGMFSGELCESTMLTVVCERMHVLGSDVLFELVARLRDTLTHRTAQHRASILRYMDQ